MSLSEQNRALIERLLDRCAISHQTADYLVDHWGQANLILDAARAEGVAALQQAGEPISRENLEAELRETIGLYVREAVTRMFSEENATYRCARQIAGMLQPGYYLHRKLFSSPLPQQTALVEQGVEKIIAPHEPAACGEGTVPSPSEPPRSGGDEG